MKFAKILPVAVLCLALQTQSKAQAYSTAIGVRLDNSTSLTLQQMFNKKYTLEAIGQGFLGGNQTGLTGIFEHHRKIFFRSLNVYTGLGGHYYWKMPSATDNGSVDKTVWGLTGVVGAEITLGRINIGIDYKPELHLSGEQVNPFQWHGLTLSARYVIAKRPKHTVADYFKKKK